MLPRIARIPALVAAGGATVGVRIPAHPVAQALLRAADLPVAAPSANRFMHTSPTTAAHVLADLDGRIACVLDGGPTTVGVESTVRRPHHQPAAPAASRRRHAGGIYARFCPNYCTSGRQNPPIHERTEPAPNRPVRRARWRATMRRARD